jgi:hypothetical protein
MNQSPIRVRVWPENTIAVTADERIKELRRQLHSAQWVTDAALKEGLRGTILAIKQEWFL